MNLIIVEGNIGAGKTTLCKALGKVLNYEVFLEPVKKNPYLELFYKEPKLYATKMQLFLLRKRFSVYLAALKLLTTNKEKVKGVILDRSIFTDYVFAINSYKNDDISDIEFEYYNKLRIQMIAQLPPPSILLYVDVSPETCYKRIHEVRCRECEKPITLEYLQSLDKNYKDFLEGMKDSTATCITLDRNNFGEINEIVSEIKMLKDCKLNVTGCNLKHLFEDEEKLKHIDVTEDLKDVFCNKLKIN